LPHSPGMQQERSDRVGVGARCLKARKGKLIRVRKAGRPYIGPGGMEGWNGSRRIPSKADPPNRAWEGGGLRDGEKCQEGGDSCDLAAEIARRLRGNKNERMVLPWQNAWRCYRGIYLQGGRNRGESGASGVNQKASVSWRRTGTSWCGGSSPKSQGGRPRKGFA